MKPNNWLYIRLGLIIASASLCLWRGPVSAHAEPPIDTHAIAIGLLFGIFGLQFVLAMQFINKRSPESWQLPSWKTNPFQFKQPIQFFHFGAWLFIASSFVTTLLTWLRNPKFILDALMPLFIGIGLLLGVQLSRFLFRSKYRAV
jgi:hypothetical protein